MEQLIDALLGLPHNVRRQHHDGAVVRFDLAAGKEVQRAFGPARDYCRHVVKSGLEIVFPVNAFVVECFGWIDGERGLQVAEDFCGRTINTAPAGVPVAVEASVLLRVNTRGQQIGRCPRNMSKWGIILHRGVRQLSDHDFDTIISESRKIAASAS